VGWRWKRSEVAAHGQLRVPSLAITTSRLGWIKVFCLLFLLLSARSVIAQTCTGGLVADTLSWSDATLGWQSSMNGNQGPHTLYSNQGVTVTVTLNNTCAGSYQGGSPQLISGELQESVDWPNTACQVTLSISFTVNGAAYNVRNLSVTVKDVDSSNTRTTAPFNGWDDQVTFSPAPTTVTVGANVNAIANGGEAKDNTSGTCSQGTASCWITSQWNGPLSSFSSVYGSGPHAQTNPPQQVVYYSNLTFCVDPATVPVTVSSFSATSTGDGVQFDWTTATETANVGFYLYGGSGSSWQRLTPQLIPSQQLDSLVPQTYSHTIAGVRMSRFALAEVDMHGQERLHGPYELGQSYGQRSNPEPIDWSSIRAEQPMKVARSLATRTATASPPAYALGVDTTGLYRVAYEDLAAAGFNLTSVPVGNIALTKQGRPIALRVEPGKTPGVFGPGGFVEFFGEALDTLYTTTNVYRLAIDPTKVERIREFNLSPVGTPPTFYTAKVTVEENHEYSFASPNGDPWYDAPILAFTSPVVKSFIIPVDKLVTANGAILQLGLWGVTDWPDRAPDHHVVVSLNGVKVADKTFDGLVDASLTVSLPSGLVKEGANTLLLTLPGDTGADFDLVHVESYGVTYARSFAAQHDRLTFKGFAGKFQVDQLTSPDVVVYGLSGRQLLRFPQVTTSPGRNGTFSAVFAGRSDQSATYMVSTVKALRKPAITPISPPADLLAGRANYLIITHAKFINGLGALVTARQQQGFTVKVVDVEDLYTAYSGGVFDPEAIRRYLRDVRPKLGVEYVLLVGGDSYDYHDYLQLGSTSFIPTLYVQTDSVMRFTPSDPLLTDLDGDQVPDLAIGRFPVRTQQELASLVAKTLAYTPRAKNAVFAADGKDSASFSALSDQLIATLPSPWSVQTQTAYIDDIGVVGARNVLVSAINSGVALTNYIGHSGPTAWSFANLFTVQDAASLLNSTPTVILQSGCWGAYHSAPQYNTLSHALLLSGKQGAAAVVGAATLTELASDQALGLRIISTMLQPKQTLGKALQKAKKDLVATQGNKKDVVLGLTLLGDPALVLAP